MPNDEFFYRLDAANNVFYEVNEQYRNAPEYPITSDSLSEEELNNRLTEVLKGIGVDTYFEDKNTSVRGKADILNRAVYAVFNKEGINTLPEEAAHMFVAFIKNKEPKLYNTMMADITKLPIYQEVKEQYLPIYNDLNLVKEEAIGKAISEHIIQGRPVPGKKIGLEDWFTKVLNALKKILSDLGFKTIDDYNSTFLLTAENIIEGRFSGDFEGEDRTLLSTDIKTPMDKLDAVDSILQLREDGYYYQGKKVPNRVTEKVQKKFNRNREEKAKTSLDEARIDWGTKGHQDLMNLVKQALAHREGKTFDFTPTTPVHITTKLKRSVS